MKHDRKSGLLTLADEKADLVGYITLEELWKMEKAMDAADQHLRQGLCVVRKILKSPRVRFEK